MPVLLGSGDQRDARGLDHRRAALAFGETRGLFLVRVHASKLFAVRVINGDQKMVVLAAAILAKTISLGLLGGYLLGHFTHSLCAEIACRQCLKEEADAQVPR